MFEYAHLCVSRDSPDFHRVEAPLLEHAENFVLAALLRNQQHPFLRFAQHDFVRSHAGLALRNPVQFDFDAGAAARSHFARRASQTGRAHVLNADDRARLHCLQAGFEQQLFEKRISHLHVRPLRFRAFAEFLAGHGRAVNAIASCLGADIDDGIAFA